MIDLLFCFAMILIQSVSMRSLRRTSLGGWNFLVSGMGFSFSSFPPSSHSRISVCSEASGAIGYGAFDDNKWFHGRWSPHQIPLSVAYKEPFPVVLAAHVLDHRCSRRRILFHVDNEAVVQTLNSRTFTDPNINHLLRSLLKVAVRLSYTFTALHVPGKNNGVADALSRFNWQGFRSQAPYATKSPVPISRHLVAQLSTVIYKLATFPS